MDFCWRPLLFHCLYYNNRLWRPDSQNSMGQNCYCNLFPIWYSINGVMFKQYWRSNGKVFSIHLLANLLFLLCSTSSAATGSNELLYVKFKDFVYIASETASNDNCSTSKSKNTDSGCWTKTCKKSKVKFF
jgi:hypothetical protein